MVKPFAVEGMSYAPPRTKNTKLKCGVQRNHNYRIKKQSQFVILLLNLELG